MAVLWGLILLLGLSAFGVRVHSQPDSLGFISIDCGIPENSKYVDAVTTLTYTSDNQFIDTGTNRNISAGYVTPSLARRYLTVRSFTTGRRNCYTMNSLMAGQKYLVRAMFLYANYDGLNKPPVFDVHVGVNFLQTINISDAGSPEVAEVIMVVPASYLQVCLVDTGEGTPFISSLEVRPLKAVLYPAVNGTQALVLYRRINVGPTDTTRIRYPNDTHDRIWVPGSNFPDWSEIFTPLPVRSLAGDRFEAPSAVLQSAAVPAGAATKLEFFWSSAADPDDPDNNAAYVAVLHFAEIQALPPRAAREFNIYLNGELWYGPFSPAYLSSDYVYSANPSSGYPHYNFTIVATAASKLPPILNALEVLQVLQMPGLATDGDDVTAIAAIKTQYQVKRYWMGDPCAPKAYSWDGLSCSYSPSNPPRITALNLSSGGLTGNVTTSFAKLTTLQSLDLSHNNLTGLVPDVLAQLPLLTFLDLTGNQLNGSIPANLLKKSQDGSLTLRFGENVNICADGSSCAHVCANETLCGPLLSPLPPPIKKSSIAPVIVIIPIVVVVLLVVVILVLCRMRKRPGLHTNPSTVRPQHESYSREVRDQENSSLQLENRQFTYNELELLTNNFSRELGKGGFGSVYEGILENGTPVAVKMRSHSSKQGVKEFLAEAQHLTRVHHKNLVSMIGYCKDGDYLALVYEFMSEGTLEKHLKGKAYTRPLTWKQRLRISLEAAQGLEYLHKGCKPPLIHRDVKTNNILLNANLEAKVADFGLSKPFNSDAHTHVSTAVVGTPGYVDPEYYTTSQLSEKSDVYSFGIVLLEVITGQPAILPAPENAHIVQWVRQRLSRGNIESVADPRMRGEYDINCVWKAADLALKCTEQSSIQRPTMTDTVMQLKECMELEEAGERSNNYYSGNSNTYSRGDNLHTETGDSQNSAFELEYMPMMPAGTGPAAR
ncbi:probable LRR receptor-like serine/threonine-protein kinase At1g51880 [Ananas comosus]|uniref:non-specific serine/threonine protein kinase n=1 Tax=Ananas comosus TaxID=4615 RepID=A0A6P5GJ12_ANACO|nr:probable LRR receptor-like serine/threonine-protein kinase At1g51880 [Ananas comosus]